MFNSRVVSNMLYQNYQDLSVYKGSIAKLNESLKELYTQTKKLKDMIDSAIAEKKQGAKSK